MDELLQPCFSETALGNFKNSVITDAHSLGIPLQEKATLSRPLIVYITTKHLIEANG
jgi:hypothetical protein